MSKEKDPRPVIRPEYLGSKYNTKMIKKKIIYPSIKIESPYPLWKRIWVLIKNPFTYIFCGYIEY